MTSRRVLFIINPAAGAGRAPARWAALAPVLRQAGIEGDSIVMTQPGEGTRLAQEAAGRYDLLVAVGGDGTASEVASGILASESPQTVLGLVPLGTANDVAHTVGIHTLADARGALQGNRTRLIDAVKVSCHVDGQRVTRYALLFAAVGIIGALLRHTTPTVKRFFGRRLAYPVGLLRALWSYRPPEMRVTCDEQAFADRFLFVAASNTESAGGGMRFAPGARIDDGVLNVNLIEAVGRWEAFGQVRRLCRGRHVTHPKVRYLKARNMTVIADPPIEVHADGDFIGLTPTRFAVRPGALRLLVP